MQEVVKQTMVCRRPRNVAICHTTSLPASQPDLRVSCRNELTQRRQRTAQPINGTEIEVETALRNELGSYRAGNEI